MHCKAKVNEAALRDLAEASHVNYVLWAEGEGHAARLAAMIQHFEREGHFSQAARLRKVLSNYLAAHCPIN